jgi:serine/threonine protein kinase
LETDKETRTDKFWLEAHHLIKGLKFFKDNGIIHNDIKPQNILFDNITGKMKYIDFGLMRTKKSVIDSSKENKNHLGLFHWSYPFDCGFMNKKYYSDYKVKDEARRTRLKNSLSELIVANSKTNTLKLPINNPSSFDVLFTYINPDNTVPNAATRYGYIDSFFEGFNFMVDFLDYDTVLNHIADSIDIFGLGFTLQFMANGFKRLNALSLEDFTRLSSFFNKMYDFNPENRIIDIEPLLNEYENILLQNGVLTRLGKSFENNILVNKPPVPPVILAESKSDEKSPPQHLSAALEELADKDPIQISVKCPEDKEFNPNTKRCVKKCREGFSRNEKFECRKIKKIKSARSKSIKSKSVKSKSVKSCPSDKELNPNSKRCVKKCKEGFSRNEKFECRKRAKTQKVGSSKGGKTRRRGRN